ncbi:MAG TPA: hypothetical protein VKS81_02380 [Bacteroidota bacterium]|nr:hypothetical protein [Bacteroidota bacterium]
MSYILRNTIVLGVGFIVILAAGLFFTAFRLPRQIKTVDTEIAKITGNLQNTPDLSNNYFTLNNKLEQMKRNWDTRSKDIPARDITGETYGYFTRLIEQSGEIGMDVLYKGPVAKQNFGYNIYDLKGTGDFGNLFKFIWYIEDGRRLCKIPSLQLRDYESKDAKTGAVKLLVTYEMEVEAYYSPVPQLNIAPGQSQLTADVVSTNPFAPLILHDLPAPLPGEIEIELAQLKAIIPGKAFIIDKEGKTHVLAEGDPVYLGYVTKILPEQGKIECLLNKGGVSETFDLPIRVGQPIK